MEEATIHNEQPAIVTPLNIGSLPPGPKSVALLKRMEKVIARTSYCGLYGVCLQKGKGAYIEDADGNVFLDCLSAASSCSLGYGHDFLIDAYRQAASQLQQSCFVYSPNIYAIELAEKLLTIAPGDFPKKVILGLSGSDSAEGAIKAIRKYSSNQTIIHFKNDYHGSTGLSQDASDFGNLNQGILPAEPWFIEFNYPSTPAQADEVAEQIHQLLKRRKAGGILCEAIQGDAGVRVPPEGFFQKLRSITAETDTILAIDEVQSGMGRTGKWWAFEHENIVPDIFITAKSLGAGYVPISAIIGRQDVLDTLESGQHIFTYGGQPGGAAVAGRVIDYIIEQGLVAHANEIGNFLLTELQQIQKLFPDIITDVRGRGLMIGVEINIASYSLAGKVFATRCMEKGLYVGYYGVNAEVVRIEPPLIISKSEAEKTVTIIGLVAGEMQNGLIPDETYSNVHRFSIGI
jgi:4-aminobutyrate aminotransferase